jgi:uncharacterized delta-60 repeat protein
MINAFQGWVKSIAFLICYSPNNFATFYYSGTLLGLKWLALILNILFKHLPLPFLTLAMKAKILCLLLLILFGSLKSQTVSPDAGFTIGSGFNNYVYCFALQSDGKILAGGDFTSYNGNTTARLVRLNTNGSIDNTFAPGVLNNSVRAIAVQGDGKIIIAGIFTTVNGVNRSRICRLHANGTVDNTFNPGAGFNFTVKAIAIQPDGKIVAGGDFTNFNGVQANYITRLNSDGTLDQDFTAGTGFNNNVLALAIQPDGKIIAGGAFSTFNGNTHNRIVRLLGTGVIDNTFVTNTGVNSGQNFGAVFTVALQNDGKIYLGGNFSTYHNTARSRILRLNDDGSLDLTFNPGTGFSGNLNELATIAIQDNGKIICGGSFSAYQAISFNNIARINSDGAIDNNFAVGSGFNNYVYAIAVPPTQRILAGGAFNSYNGSSSPYIIRLINCTNTSSAIHLEACGSYTLNGQTWHASGVYSQTLVSSTGCDSVIDIHLTIKEASNSTIQAEACEMYELNGIGYTASGTYFQTLENAAGCDSVITLQLTVKKATSFVLQAEGCGMYELNGIAYTESGTYYQTLENAAGCDSTITLELSISGLDTGITVTGYTLQANEAGASYQWIDCNTKDNPLLYDETSQTFSPSENGLYAVIISKGACTDTSSCYQVAGLGIPKPNQQAILVYPNPAKDFIYLTGESTMAKASYRIFDFTGKCHLHGSLSPNGEKRIETKSLLPGIYILELHAAGEVKRLRFVKG